MDNLTGDKMHMLPLSNIQPRLKLFVLVSTEAGLPKVKSKSLARERDDMIATRGVVNVLPLAPDQFLWKSISNTSAQIPKATVIEDGKSALTQWTQPTRQTRNYSEMHKVNAVYKPAKDGYLLVYEHENVTKRNEKLEQNWRVKAKIPKAYVMYTKKYLQMLNGFEETWDRRLVWIHFSKHRIELSFTALKQINHMVFRAVPMVR